MNWRQINIGWVSLVIGALVYIIDRPAKETYFIDRLPFDISLHGHMPKIFGSIGSVLPDFLHVFAFILITAGILGVEKKGQLMVCAGWFIIDTLFEVGQLFRGLGDWVPGWFEGVPFLENTANYFRDGAFDIRDLISIGLGTICAYAVLRITSRPAAVRSGSSP